MIRLSNHLWGLDNIETNKKYCRVGKNQRYRKKQQQVLKIKNINSLINRITETNYETIKVEIVKLINKEYFVPLIIENLIENLSSVIDIYHYMLGVKRN